MCYNCYLKLASAIAAYVQTVTVLNPAYFRMCLYSYSVLHIYFHIYFIAFLLQAFYCIAYIMISI